MVPSVNPLRRGGKKKKDGVDVDRTNHRYKRKEKEENYPATMSRHELPSHQLWHNKRPLQKKRGQKGGLSSPA